MIESSVVELLMYQVGQLFLLPVLALVGLLFVYALYALGAFAVQAWQRRNPNALGAFPLRSHVRRQPDATEDELDLLAHRLLEKERLASRIAPMLGLVGTMIPMGPALRSLADGNLAQVSQSLTVAFSAVILALIAASITYWVSNVRRRWLAEELVALQQEKRA